MAIPGKGCFIAWYDLRPGEKELRGAPDAIADWVILVEGYDLEAVKQAKAELLGVDGIIDHGAGEISMAGLYSLDYSLGEDEAKKIWRKP